MKLIKIKRIVSSDFRYGIRTLFDELKRKRSLWQGPIEDGEAYLFVSARGDKLIFVLGETEVVTSSGTRYEAKRTLLDYRGWRIEGGVFSPSMLEDYANAVGLTLGRKTFAEQWAERD